MCSQIRVTKSYKKSHWNSHWDTNSETSWRGKKSWNDFAKTHDNHKTTKLSKQSNTTTQITQRQRRTLKSCLKSALKMNPTLLKEVFHPKIQSPVPVLLFIHLDLVISAAERFPRLVWHININWVKQFLPQNIIQAVLAWRYCCELAMLPWN